MDIIIPAMLLTLSPTIIMMNNASHRRVLPFFIASCICIMNFVLVQSTQGQGFGGFNNRISDGTAYHVYARPGEATMQIMVISSSGSSGIYEVGGTTRLDQLLVLSNAVSVDPQSRNIKRKITIRLYRDSEGNREVVYEAPLETTLLEPEQYPLLQDGDVLMIETIQRNRFQWRDAMSLISSVLSIIWIIDRFVN